MNDEYQRNVLAILHTVNEKYDFSVWDVFCKLFPLGKLSRPRFVDAVDAAIRDAMA